MAADADVGGTPAWAPPPLRVTAMPGLRPQHGVSTFEYRWRATMALLLRTAPDAATHARWLALTGEAGVAASAAWSMISAGPPAASHGRSTFQRLYAELSEAGLAGSAAHAQLLSAEGTALLGVGDRAAAEVLWRRSSRMYAAPGCPPHTAGLGAAAVLFALAEELYDQERFVEALAEAEAAATALEAWHAQAAVAASVGLVVPDRAMACRTLTLRAVCMAHCGQHQRCIALVPAAERVLAELTSLSPAAQGAQGVTVPGELGILPDERQRLTLRLLDGFTMSMAMCGGDEAFARFGRQLLARAGELRPAAARDMLCAAPTFVTGRGPSPRSAAFLTAVDMLRAGLAAGEAHFRATGQPVPLVFSHAAVELVRCLQDQNRMEEARERAGHFARLLGQRAAQAPSNDAASMAALLAGVAQRFGGGLYLFLPERGAGRTISKDGGKRMPQAQCNAPGCERDTQPGGEPLLLCAGCGSVAYCSPACQKADWKPRHKAQCKALATRRAAVEGGGSAAGGGASET